MAIPLIPWEPCNFPDQIQAELNRRRVNRAFNFISNERGGWGDDGGDWVTYKGPMSPWVRFCSNGSGRAVAKSTERPDGGIPEADYFDKEGFVLFGGKDFYSSYGFLRPNEAGGTSAGPSIIGYMPNGTPHTIDNDVRTSNYPIHVPPPEIEKITVTIQKELYRRASIEWVCFSPKQLEYMTPYFLVPGLTCILEWGWNLFDPSSLIDLTDIQLLKNLNNNPYPLYTRHILKSKGNYDVLFGKITHFEWSIDNLRIRCRTEITSQDRIYAGLTVDSSVTTSEKDQTQPTQILDSLRIFVNDVLPNIRQVTSENAGDLRQIGGGIGNLVAYLRGEYPSARFGDKADNLIYGVFFGGRKIVESPVAPATNAGFSGQEAVAMDQPATRPSVQKKDNIDFVNTTYDFDYKDPRDTWINVGLLVEILNYHSHQLVGFNDVPMFKVDIDDCVISGHPNLISTDGDVVLIPNAMAPKYFFGFYGYSKLQPQFRTDEPESGLSFLQQRNVGTVDANAEEYRKFSISDSKVNFDGFGNLARDIAEANDQLADYRLMKVCLQTVLGEGRNAYRDDLNVIINQARISKKLTGPFEFPFHNNQDSGIPNTKRYPAKFSGYLKNIYFSIKELQNILKDGSVKTFTDVLTKVLAKISDATGNFFDLRLVSATGKSGDVVKDSASMKIVDFRFIYSVNPGKVYTFDYYDADSLLQSIKFTPTLSNAQAIRTIYAETNNPNRSIVLNDDNELLNYHFKDRLFNDENIKAPRGITTSDGFKQMMATLQGIPPAVLNERKSFQVTTKTPDGKIIVKRLAMPSGELLKLLLDDGDIERNPKYTGIMPGIQAQFTIQGVGGLRTFMMFLVRNLPEPYSHKNIVFRIIDLTENLEAGKWTTTITAGIIPLRKPIKERLGIVGE